MILLLLWTIEASIRGVDNSENWFFQILKNNIFTFKHFRDYFLPLLAVSIVIYWNMWKDFHSKWEYCCNLFNQTLSASTEGTKEKLRRALAVDLLILDMWAHRAFAEHFKEVLDEAIESYPNPHYKNILKDKLAKSELTECEVQDILENYQGADC